MKKFIPLLLLTILLIPIKEQLKLSDKDIYRIAINAHQFSKRPHLNKKQIKAIPKRDRPDLAWEQNYLATMDPALGRPAPERLLPIYQQVAQARGSMMATPGAASSPWVERGPNNVSGRTRAIAYDPNDVTGKKVWAGGVTGGLWYNNDITSASSLWVAVNDFWDNIAITAIAFDPTSSNTIYVGTGEGWGTGSSRGAGIWKSTNGGTSWTQLAATTGFYYVNDLVVRNESNNGVLYAATRGNNYGQAWHGSADQGLQRSTNGGISFTQVMPNIPGESQPFAAADIEISANNTLWVGTTTSSYGLTDRGGGRILSSTNGTTWSTPYTSTGGERVEVACAPSDANYVYALIEAGNVVDDIVRTTNGGTSWTSRTEPSDADNGIPNTDFSRGQAWYDLIAAVDPNNRNTLIVGGIDLFRSTDGAGTWSQISKWSNNNNLAFLNCSEVHADQHAIVFKPGSSTQVLFGNDGGVYYTNSISTAATSNVIARRDNGYNVTQFYACAIHPTATTNYFLAGAQDNGSQQFNTAGINSTVEVSGGDGAFCFIDQTNANYQITSYVYNSYYGSTNGGGNFNNTLQSDQNTGKFINPTDYDDNQNALYSARTTTTVNRITNITGSPSVGSITVTGMSSMASHLRVSPYTTTSTTLFVGTEAGDLYKITNANGGSPSTSDISGSLPSGNISCVEIGANENELLVTYTNYGLTSVWYTSNGGSTWTSKEGNLPDMPVRWALFNPNDRNEVLLATEVGVWSTGNFNSSSPSWTASNSGLANVRVDMLQIRDSDKEVIAATYGRGLFSSSGFAAAQVPVANFGYSEQFPCTGEAVQLGDSSTGGPTSRKWTITPNTFNYGVGSSATSQNPEVTFNAPGWYSIKLKVSNANGSDSLTITQAIRAGGHSLPFSEDFETNSVSEWQVNNPDNSTTWSLFTIGGTLPGNTAAGIDNYNYNSAGQRDGLLSPAFDLTGYTQATLSFDYAYRRYSSANQDSLAVFISTNCGNTWTRVASFKENGTGNFATGTDLTSAFTPSTSSHWCGSSGNPSCPSININSFAGNANVRVKFENITGWGNNMYIDNVNITGAVSLAPVANFSASQNTICAGSSVTFTDLSTNSPNGWTWSFSPSTVTYTGGTSASSQNPQVTFNNSGGYQVSLTASNGAGSDAEVKPAYINVTTPVTPTVNIVASSTTICAGTNVNFTATPTNGGTSPSYQWKVNGVNAGTNSTTFSSSSLSNGNTVTCVMTSNESCVSSATATSNGINMTVNSAVTPSVNVSASATSICSGTMVNFTASPTNGGSNPTYQWKVNGVNAGSNSATFSTSTLSNGNIITCVMQSNAACPSPTSATSSGITMTVNNAVTPTLSITASATSICSGTPVTFTATPVAGGTTPNYQWKVNGVNAGTNSSTFNSSTLTNAAVVTCVMTSSESCVTTSNATSNGITITVNNAVTPSVTIAASTTTVCQGSNVTFSAAPVNGGATPTYQWKVNGINVGSNSPNFSSTTLANNDLVTVDLTSGLACATPSTISSTAISMAVIQKPLISVTTPLPIVPLCAGDTLNLSATVNNFGQAGNGVWSGPGVQNGKFIASNAGTGTYTVTYTYTYSNPPACSNSQTSQITVENVPKPTITNNNMVLTCNQNGYNYQWFDGGNPIAGATSQNYTVIGNGSYTVRIGLTNCTDVSDPTVIQNFGMGEVKALVGFKLYPNPTSGIAAFVMTNPGVSSISYNIIAFNGAVVLRKQVAAGATLKETVDLTPFSNGMYTLRIVAGELIILEKITKQ